MKAIVQHTYGSADVLQLQEIDKPVINDDEVLVRVHAASVNPLDWHIMRGRPFLLRFVSGLRKPKPAVRGVDVAGHVEAVGENVTRLQPGDEVFGWCQGAFAEYASAGESNLLPKPASLTHEQAAAVPIAAFTALQGLRDLGRIESGQRVLIIGASGGVGTFAVQIAKSFGAEVTGVCSTRNLDLIRSIGADHVIDYTQDDVTEGEQQYDLVFQLAGAASPSSLRRVLTPKGTLVLSSGMGRFSGIDRIIKALASSPFVSQRQVTWVAKENQEDLAFLAELLEAGKVTPVIDRSYRLSEVPEAIRYLEEGHTQGKVVITV
jgi:NADPH:quinone reductase-like Zn-dependent oxidoreductase